MPRPALLRSLLAVAALGCASAPPPAEAPAAEPDPEIAALERAIAADQAAITAWISDPETAKTMHDDLDALAVIAERLPRLQAQLVRLRARAAAGGPDGAAEAESGPDAD